MAVSSLATFSSHHNISPLHRLDVHTLSLPLVGAQATGSVQEVEASEQLARAGGHRATGLCESGRDQA